MIMSEVKEKIENLKSKPVFRTVMFFVIIVCIASLLIMLGRRSDAVTQARRLQAGVLTADEISTAFENVGGKLIKRLVNESQEVKKGDLLLEIDSQDIEFNIASLKAQIENLTAQIEAQQITLDNSRDRLRTTEISTWRSIEDLLSQLDSAQAELTRASAEYKRYANLDKAAAVSKSSYDQARAVYLQAQAAVTSTKKNLDNLTLGATKEQLEKLRTQRDATGMTLSAISQQRTDTENIENTLRSLKASRDSLKAQLAQQELNLSRTRLYAPEDGKVLEVLFDEGEMVSASSTAVVLETTRKYYDVYISERAATHYRAGDKVTGYCYALDKNIDGTVRFVESAPSFADLRMTREQGQADLTSFKMRVYTDKDGDLLSGMTVEIANDYD